MPGKFWFKTRGLLMAPPVLVMLLCTWGETEWEAVLWPVGVSVFAPGLLLRFWAQLHLRYRLSAKTGLTTTGPYRFIRNPIYIANTLILTALCILSELLWLCPLVVAYCALVYDLVVRYEEGHLSAKYGQAYLAYQKSVPRWLLVRGPHGSKPSAAVSRFVWPALLCEAHNLLLLILPLIKEAVLGA